MAALSLIEERIRSQLPGKRKDPNAETNGTIIAGSDVTPTTGIDSPDGDHGRCQSSSDDSGDDDELNSSAAHFSTKKNADHSSNTTTPKAKRPKLGHGMMSTSSSVDAVMARASSESTPGGGMAAAAAGGDDVQGSNGSDVKFSRSVLTCHLQVLMVTCEIYNLFA